MPEVTLSWGAILGATISSMVVGYLWYGPMLFASMWMKEVGKTEAELKKEAVGSKYWLTLIAAFVTAYVMSHFVDYAQATTFAEGAVTGFWVWLGFVATTFLSTTLFEGRTMRLYAINVGYHLVVLVVMGMILAAY